MRSARVADTVSNIAIAAAAVVAVVVAQAVVAHSLRMREPVCRALQKTFAATATARTSAHKNTATQTMGLEPTAGIVPPGTLELRTTGHLAVAVMGAKWEV